VSEYLTYAKISQFVRFEVFTAVTTENAIFWDATLFGFCKNLRFGETHEVFLQSVRRLIVIANVVPSSLILVTQMMDTVRYSETSVVTKATRRNIPEDDILHFTVSLVREMCEKQQLKPRKCLYISKRSTDEFL
jgi:hypothetical protein